MVRKFPRDCRGGRAAGDCGAGLHCGPQSFVHVQKNGRHGAGTQAMSGLMGCSATKGGRGAFFNGGATATRGLRVRVGCGRGQRVQWHGCAGDEGEGPGAAEGEGGFLSCIAGCERGCELAAAVWLHPRAYGAWETRKNGAAGVDGKGRGTRSDTGKEKEWFGVVVVVGV